jgi:rod shape determining protein RodA
MLKNNELSINFKNIKKIDYTLVIIIIALFSIGLMMLYSAAGGNLKPWASLQLKRFLLFLPICILIAIVNIKIIYRYAYFSYFFSLILLLYVDLFGVTSMGAKRWINLYVINLQPSEVMKITLIIALSKYFNNIHIKKIQNLHSLLIPIFLTLIPVYLILKQPDLGTALIILSTAILIFFIAGVGIAKFIISGVSLLLFVPFMWHGLKDYQKQRILTYLNPDNDPLGSGYNIIQSKIAIGSGGILGQGYLSGSQGQLNFLPEPETDFIFTMIAEEFGFAGSMIIIILFSILFYRIINIAIKAQASFSKYLVAGILTFIFLHFFINISMVIGLIPVVGAPLPLISYGGTILIMTMLSLSLIINADINHNVILSKHSKIK